MQELVRKTVEGDREAWEGLWESIEPMIWSLTGRGRLTGRVSQRRQERGEILDAVKTRLQAEDFSSLRRYLEAADERSKRSSFKAWLATITTRAALDHVRAESSRHPVAHEDDDGHARGRIATPADLVAALEMLEIARKTLSTDRVAALHLWLQGGADAEIAKGLRLDGAADGARLVRSALEQLRTSHREDSQQRCPAIADLLSGDGDGSAVGAHRADCAACAGVSAIRVLRQQGQNHGSALDDCPDHEAMLAAMVDGSIEDHELARLTDHLDSCGRCARVLVSLGLFRNEIERLTKARATAGGAAAEGASEAAHESTHESTRGADTLVRPTRRWVRVAQLLAIALLAVAAGLWLGRGTSPETAGGSRSAQPLASTRPGVPGSAARTAGSSSPAPTAQGLLNVRCRPRCDEVVVDSIRYGASPVLQRRLAPGLHSVQLVRADTSKRVAVGVHANETTSLVVELEPGPASAPPKSSQPTPAKAAGDGATDEEPGHLSVACAPACTSIRLDGDDLGASPLVRRQVAPGSHLLELQAGATARSLTLFVEPRETKSLHMVMGPPAG